MHSRRGQFSDGTAVVNALYRLVLGRDADPSGLRAFKPNLVYGRTAQCAPYTAGTMTIDAIVNNIANSPEAWVQRAFESCNAGSPTADQMRYWSNFFSQTRDGAKLTSAVCEATPPGAIPPAPPTPPIRNSVPAGTRFNAGDTLEAGGTCGFRAIMQGDGNFVIYRGTVPHWSTGTAGNPGAAAIFQGDGNFVVYRANNTVAFNSGTNGRGGVTMILQTDGNLVILNASGRPVWSIGKVVAGCR